MSAASSAFCKASFQDCLDYIETYWSKIERFHPEDSATLIGLPRPYLVPNHRMFNEQYYWDTYFVCVGLENTGREKFIVDMTENLLYLFERFGRIPNANRYYFLSRSQPPVLSRLILMSFEVLKRTGGTKKAKDWLTRAFLLARREYRETWRNTAYPDEREVYKGLSRYYDLNIWHDTAEAESGWDMTPRYDDRCLDFLPIDLNCFLHQYECDFAEIAAILGDDNEQNEWQSAADTRRKVVSELCWNAERSFFFDFDYRNETRSDFLSAAGFFPLWSGLASEDQALAIIDHALPLLEMNHGIVTTEKWVPLSSETPRQWAWPNGWAPLHWIIVSGLERYGFHAEARRIALKWVKLVNQVFEEKGENFEKYDVVEGANALAGRYPDQPGFGWTNAIFARFIRYLESGVL